MIKSVKDVEDTRYQVELTINMKVESQEDAFNYREELNNLIYKFLDGKDVSKVKRLNLDITKGYRY